MLPPLQLSPDHAPMQVNIMPNTVHNTLFKMHRHLGCTDTNWSPCADPEAQVAGAADSWLLTLIEPL